MKFPSKTDSLFCRKFIHQKIDSMNIKIIAASVLFPSILVILAAVSGCRKTEEMTLSEIQALIEKGDSVLVEKTVSKPYSGEKFKSGKRGGVWNDTLLSDPKTFNQHIAERDATSAGIISLTLDSALEYDPTLREWKSHCASAEIETDEKNNTLTVHYTLRDDIFWSWHGKEEKVPVTSDDIVFWYNEIEGDEAFQSSGFNSHFVAMEDGGVQKIQCVKIDEKRFDFIYPRIVADPFLSSNPTICPSFIYKKAKDEGGAEGVKNLFSADADVKTIPSCGKWYITEYAPAQRLVLKRNPYYWEKDEDGTNIPYYDEKVFQIVGDQNTDYLLFRQGKTELYSVRPEELYDVVENQKDGYSVFNAEGSLGSQLWSFNQNPKNKDKSFYRWFSSKKFRQAMSCLLNRDRIISQTFRGLAEPNYSFFSEINPFYDPDIELEYKYNPGRALSLLESDGFYLDGNVLSDNEEKPVEFDISVPSSSAAANDIAVILSDELSKVGIRLNVRQVEFQKMVEDLTKNYDWQSIIIGLGTNSFPSQGSNVWPSSGNLHLWNPLQEKPATEWEARIDYLYNEGSYTIDREKAKAIWDEYQRIILDECPVIYLVRQKSFAAVRDRWSFENFYYDNRNGAMTDWIFLSDSWR